jgi:hypothetical protein
LGYFERKKVETENYSLGVLLMSLALLLINTWAGILVISMIFISIGEILLFRFQILSL